MGLPKILIEFKTLAETLIARSERGIVAVILKDNSNTTKTAVYTKESEIVKSHYTATNLAYLSLVFMGGPSKYGEIQNKSRGAGADRFSDHVSRTCSTAI